MTRGNVRHGLTVQVTDGGQGIYSGDTGHVVQQRPSGDVVVDLGWCELVTGPESLTPVFEGQRPRGTHKDKRDAMAPARHINGATVCLDCEDQLMDIPDTDEGITVTRNTQCAWCGRPVGAAHRA